MKDDLDLEEYGMKEDKSLDYVLWAQVTIFVVGLGCLFGYVMFGDKISSIFK